MAELPPEIVEQIHSAARRVEIVRLELATSRRVYRKTIADAHAQGHSLAAIGRAVGVSRQHVKRIIDET